MGGMSCIMARDQLRFEAVARATQYMVPVRSSWLFDTFQGMTAPTEEDGQRANAIYKQIASGATPIGIKDDALRYNRDHRWNFGPLQEVVVNMGQSNLAENRTHFVVGPAEHTLRIGEHGRPRPRLPSQIAILRLDTDFYASTKAELEVLWPLLQPGGWLTVDDYYTWGGAQKAVDDWLVEHNWTQAARKVHAFLPSKHGPTPGLNYVFKSDPFDEAAPFGAWTVFHSVPMWVSGDHFERFSDNTINRGMRLRAITSEKQRQGW